MLSQSTTEEKASTIKLQVAIITQNSRDVETLLKANPSLLDQCINYFPLHLAVEARSPDIIKLLLAHDADPTVKNRKNMTPIMSAAELKYWECVRAIALFRTDENDAAQYGEALWCAVQENEVLTAHALLSAGVTKLSFDPPNILMQGAVSNTNLAMVELLKLLPTRDQGQLPEDLAKQLNSLYSTEQKHEYPYQCFINRECKTIDEAISNGDPAKIESLINDNNINQPIDFVFRMSFLMAAIVHAKSDIVTFLLKNNKIDINIADAIWHYTALAWSLTLYKESQDNMSSQASSYKKISLQLINAGAGTTHSSVRSAFTKIRRQDDLFKELNDLVNESKSQESKESSSNPSIIFNICTLLGYKYLIRNDPKADPIFLKARQIAEKNNIHSEYVRQTIGLSDSFSIKYNDIKLSNEILGKGSFGVVFKATWGNRQVAVKQLLDSDDASIQAFKRETRVLGEITKLGCNNVVHYYGSFVTNNSNYGVVMECMPNSLFDLLCNNASIPLLTLYKIMYGATQALHGLHAIEISHRDVKIDNILLNDAMEAKLADFGSATVNGSKEHVDTTNPAPEVIMGEQYTAKSDIYSLGVVFWGMVARVTFNVPHKDIVEGKRKPIPPTCGRGLARLINWCWTQEPINRPTTEEVLKKLDDLIEIEKASMPRVL